MYNRGILKYTYRHRNPVDRMNASTDSKYVAKPHDDAPSTPKQANGETDKKSSFPIKVIAIVVAVVALGLVGATFLLTPENKPPGPATDSVRTVATVDVTSNTVVVANTAGNNQDTPTDVFDDVKNIGSGISTSVSADVIAKPATMGEHLAALPGRLAAFRNTVFGSTRNIAIFSAVVTVVVLLIAGAIVAGVLLSNKDPIVDPKIKPDNSPNAVADRNLASFLNYFAENQAAAILAITFTALFLVTLVVLIIFFSCRARSFGLLGPKDFFKANMISLIVIGVLIALSVLFAVLTAFAFPELMKNPIMMVAYMVAGFCSTVFALPGLLTGTIVLGVLAVVSIFVFSCIHYQERR